MEWTRQHKDHRENTSVFTHTAPNPYEGVYAAARLCNGKELGRSLRYTYAAGSGPCEAVGTMVLCARL
jgi:hypothetical protein